MINIVNIFATRECNRKCEYCGIATNASPFAAGIYNERKRKMQHALYSDWALFYERLKAHNPNAFTIFYGGEPFLNPTFMNHSILWYHENDMPYTIISNCSAAIRKNVYTLISHIGEPLKGFTASIDPYPHLLTHDPVDRFEMSEEEEKSHDGFIFLTELIEKGLVKDPVAEITADPKTLKFLERSIDILNSYGICCDVTVIDQAKNSMYDFSNVISSNAMVEKSVAKLLFARLVNSEKNIHMKKEILPIISENLPSNYDCKLEEGLHNISIEPDLNLRLCLRIGGRFTYNFSALDLFNDDGTESSKYKDIVEAMVEDKNQYCERCIWSCAMMSKFESGSALH